MQNHSRFRFMGGVLLGTLSFHAAFLSTDLAFLMLIYLACVLDLQNQPTTKLAFRWGVVVGLMTFAPQLAFFFKIFKLGALLLWLVLAVWIGLFAALIHASRRHFGLGRTATLAPFLWLGLEYARSELYYLRFSWLTPGFAFSEAPAREVLYGLGVYGLGFVLMSCAALHSTLRGRFRTGFGIAALVAVALGGNVPLKQANAFPVVNSVKVAGVQLEFPSVPDLLTALDSLVEAHPEAELLVLSEYTLDGPVPLLVRKWCANHQKYLLVGGKDPLPGNFYNTVFAIDPKGETVFKQVKAVPIQFFADGLPAPSQEIWRSPWGAIGISICYDLNYRKVMDVLVRQGAEALICPTMDVEAWGLHQHRQHARTAPIRAAEYRLPVFKVASSGFSQWVRENGSVGAVAGYPGQGERLAGTLEFRGRGRLPLDHFLAPGAAAITLMVAGVCLFPRILKSR